MKRIASFIAFGACLVFTVLLSIRIYGIVDRAVNVLPDLRVAEQVAAEPMIVLVEAIAAVGFAVLGFALYTRKESSSDEADDGRSAVLKLT